MRIIRQEEARGRLRETLNGRFEVVAQMCFSSWQDDKQGVNLLNGLEIWLERDTVQLQLRGWHRCTTPMD